MLRDSPRIYAGAAELIQALHGKVRLAVVTGTWRENAQAVLESAGLDGYFETIVSKQDVKSNKPDPEPYLLALERLDLAPSSAVAFEDSPTGASSARGAGVPLIAVGHRHPTGDWIGESPYIAGFTPIRAVLERLGLAAHPA
jgi:HAD superfamily hydrolase (TIGR01509 family)